MWLGVAEVLLPTSRPASFTKDTIFLVPILLASDEEGYPIGQLAEPGLAGPRRSPGFVLQCHMGLDATLPYGPEGPEAEAGCTQQVPLSPSHHPPGPMEPKVHGSKTTQLWFTSTHEFMTLRDMCE
jgi:hypothetical protein